MYAFIIVIHIFVCLVLIAVILLQAGRGGGMSDMFGGGQPNSILGTQSNVFMTRATEVCAVLFVITSLTLGILSTQKGKSLIEKEMMLRSLKGAAPAIPALPADAPKESAAVAAPAVESAQKTSGSSEPASIPAGSAPVSPAAKENTR
jgi:preprotein translocase subunit SecG